MPKLDTRMDFTRESRLGAPLPLRPSLFWSVMAADAVDCKLSGTLRCTIIHYGKKSRKPGTAVRQFQVWNLKGFIVAHNLSSIIPYHANSLNHV